jgi:hypothetical protein
MILGLSVPAFTLLHVIISLVGIGAGIVVMLGLLNANRLEGWTALFLLATALTNITGFFFLITQPKVGPPHVVGVISLVVLVPTLLGRYVYGLAGWWRIIYVVGAVIVLYLNCFVAVIQFFQKFSFLQPLAPTQTEPPFVITQVVMLAIFVVVGIVAAIRFRPAASA